MGLGKVIFHTFCYLSYNKKFEFTEHILVTTALSEMNSISNSLLNIHGKPDPGYKALEHVFLYCVYIFLVFL